MSNLSPHPPRINYHAYLNSDAWRTKRLRALARAGHKCQLCGKTGPKLQAHHNTYARIGNELDTDLVILCDPCHEAFHKKKKAKEENTRPISRKEKRIIQRMNLGIQTVMLTATEKRRRRNVAAQFAEMIARGKKPRPKGVWVVTKPDPNSTAPCGHYEFPEN